MKPTTTLLISALTFAGGLGIGLGSMRSAANAQPSTPAQNAPGPTGHPGEASPNDEVLARVNGVPIYRSDVQLKIDTGSHETSGAKSPEAEQNILQALITREVLAQEARKRGLDQDPAYLGAAKKLGAQARGFERQELSELLLRHEGQKRGAATDEAVNGYFERNKKRITTQLHVLQILRRSEAQAVEARNAIQGGKSFEEVAEGLVPTLPDGRRPWDLGFLSFSKIPDPWREWVYELKAGETSGIIKGPNDRYWIVKVVEIKNDPSITVDTAREAIVAELQKHGESGARTDLEEQLRAAATIEMSGH